MAEHTEKKAVTLSGSATELERVSNLLGGRKILGSRLKTPLDAHEMILRGLPAGAIIHLVDHLRVLSRVTSIEVGIGISERTFQRRKDADAKPLSKEQSGRAWKFAEILAKATEVLGTQEEAEKWLERPAIGLNRRRPIDLLATPAGVELVEDHLTRLEYGVYA
jgi:putative toxin-antitoxin system antitoxin component (TIGR02293 family)